MRALAQVAEIVHGAPYRFSDPARFSVAHGGKDRHPFPVPLKVLDRTIAVMKSAVVKARLGATEELAALRRLDDQARRLEAAARGPSAEALFAEERARSHEYGGRSVFGFEPRAGAPLTRRLRPRPKRCSDDPCALSHASARSVSGNSRRVSAQNSGEWFMC